MLGFCDPYSTKAVNMKRSILVMALVAAITAGGMSAANAAQDMFLKIDGVQGDSLDRAHASEIDVLSWSWGATNSGTTQMGGGGGAGKTTFNDLTITKFVDSSSPVLFANLSTGKHMKTATLTVRNAGQRPVDYYTLTLNEVIISAIALSANSGDSRINESVTLDFASYTYTFLPLKADGTPKPAVVTKFSIMENRLL